MRNQRGFTLLEMLVATTLMAIVVVGILSTLSTTTRNAAKLTDHDRAAMFARRKLDELLVDTKLPRAVPLEGMWDPTYTNGKQSGWRATILPFEWPPNPAPGIRILDRVAVEVWWMEQSGERRTFSIEGFRSGELKQRDLQMGLLGTTQEK
jgi:general secretion pathway protein I